MESIAPGWRGPMGAGGIAGFMTDDRYRVQSLGRGLDLLDLIARSGRDGTRLTDLAAGIGLSKAATYAMLQTFLARAFVIAIGEGTGRRYRLGMSLVRLGDLATSNIALTDIAMPILRALTQEVGLTSRLAVLDDGYAVVVGRADGPGAVRFDAALGRRELPHCSAVGKALLAAMPRTEARAILQKVGTPRRTPRTLAGLTVIEKDLDGIAKRGYAVDDEEDTEGVVCLGTCIFDRAGAAIGAISVTGLKQSYGERGQEQFAEIVIRHADQISGQLDGMNGASAWSMRRKPRRT